MDFEFILFIIFIGFFAFLGLLRFLFKESPKSKLRALNLNPPAEGETAEELARRIGSNVEYLQAIEVSYQDFTIPKRSGSERFIQAPNVELKKIQRQILNRLLSRLKIHPAATGFEKKHSIVTNALAHVGAEVVLRMDVKGFFASTTEDRVRAYLYGIGWGQEAADIIIRLCTYNGALPQGAPTSPRLSNLINFELDARLDGWAKLAGAMYTRYADDITFSFQDLNKSEIESAPQNQLTLERVPRIIHGHDVLTSTIRITKKILAEYGYTLHIKQKLNIRRRHQQQKVTGLVVNEKVTLPRKTRRWLRAVKNHLENGKSASLTQEQFAGWQALQQMIDKQAGLAMDN